jgi:hypothetical protein
VKIEISLKPTISLGTGPSLVYRTIFGLLAGICLIVWGLTFWQYSSKAAVIQAFEDERVNLERGLKKVQKEKTNIEQRLREGSSGAAVIFELDRLLGFSCGDFRKNMGRLRGIVKTSQSCLTSLEMSRKAEDSGNGMISMDIFASGSGAYLEVFRGLNAIKGLKRESVALERVEFGDDGSDINAIRARFRFSIVPVTLKNVELENAEK